MTKHRDTDETQKRCIGTRKDGSPCEAKAVTGSDYCLAHDPARVVEMAEWRRQGGKASSNASRARKAAAGMNPVEIVGILGGVLAGVLAGDYTPGQANAAASVARAMMQIHEMTALEERIAALEARAGVGASSGTWRA
jgi:hypothetical protein